MRSGKRVAIICSSGIAAKGRFFHDSDISKKMGRLVTRQTMLVLFYYFFKPFKFRRVCGVCSFELWLARKNNCLLSSTFPAGEGGFGQMMYWSPERSPLDSRDGNFLHSAQASFSWPRVDLARLLRRACSRSFWIISFEFAKVCWIRFSIWESFIGFYICCYSISTILACLFEFRGKSCVEREHGASPTLSQINECLLPCIIYRFSQG